MLMVANTRFWYCSIKVNTYIYISYLILCIYCSSSIVHYILLAFCRIYFLSLFWLPFLSSFSLHRSMLNWDELTFLRNNAITSMDASHYTRVCLCVYDTQWRARFLPGGKHWCSLLFLLLFQITVCFINAMLIWFPLLFWSLASRKIGKLKGVPLI